MDYVHQISEAESSRIQRFGYVILGATIAFVLAVVVAIVTADTWLLMISTDSEKRFIDPYIELAEDNLLQSSEPDLQAYVDQVTLNLTAHMDVPTDIQLDVRVIKGEMVNAFTTLGGYIFVTDGLIGALDNENSLAMVLAHEIAHARQRDPLLGTGRGMLIGLLITSLSGSGGSPVAMGDIGSQLMLNMYSREQERTADRLALSALHSLYGHVGGATQLFEVVGDEDDPTASIESLSTHPQLEDRIESIETIAAQAGWLQQAVEPYPAVVVEQIRKL